MKFSLKFWKKSNEITKPWPLFKLSLKEYRENWKLLTAITGIVAVPVVVLSNTVASASTDTSLSAYLAFGQLIMNVALIYAIINLGARKKMTIKRSYYEGSTALVRFMLVSLLLILMLLPLFFGFLIFIAGVLVPGTGLGPVEQLLLLLVALLIATPSVILITRGFTAIYIVFQKASIGPVEAISLARKATDQKVLATLGRVLALGIFLLLLLAGPAIVLFGLTALTGLGFFSVVFQLVASLVALPIANIYLYRLYQRLAA